MYDGVRHLLFIVPMLALLAGAALTRIIPVLRPYPLVALTALLFAIVQVGAALTTMVMLHPLEYTAMNSLAGGVNGSYRRFELDYSGAAATEAVRRLEQRLDQDLSGRYAMHPPHVLVCIPWRETRVGTLFRRNWLVETDPHKADFIIGTERRNCGEEIALVPIDRVERFGRVFAWTYANNHRVSD